MNLDCRAEIEPYVRYDTYGSIPQELLKGVEKCIEIIADQQHIVDGQRARQNECPQRIIKSHALDNQEGRNHTGAKKHREHKEHIQRLMSWHLFLRKYVSRHCVDDNRKKYKGKTDDQGIDQRPNDRFIFKYEGICIQAEFSNA